MRREAFRNTQEKETLDAAFVAFQDERLWRFSAGSREVFTPAENSPQGHGMHLPGACGAKAGWR